MNNNIICITPIDHIRGVYDNLKSCGDISYYPEIGKEQLRDVLSKVDYNTIFTNPNKQNYIIDEQVLFRSNIKNIITASTGLNHIDRNCCASLNIKVYSLTKEYNIINKITSTAEHSFGLILSLIRNIPVSHYDVIENKNWDYTKYIGKQLTELTLGIIGYGRLGKMIAKYAKAFGMGVQIYDPPKGYNDLRALQKQSDILTLHVHPNENTIGMITKEYLERFQNKIYLINTSRGEIVDEDSIIKCLKNGKLYGYATDVIKDEFGGVSESKIVNYAKNLNIIITPHVGGMTTQAQEIAYNGIISRFKTEQTEL